MHKIWKSDKIAMIIVKISCLISAIQQKNFNFSNQVYQNAQMFKCNICFCIVTFFTTGVFSFLHFCGFQVFPAVLAPFILPWWEKKRIISTMLSFSHIIFYPMIYYDIIVTLYHKFFYTNYGARIWPRRSPPEFNVNLGTFHMGPNPGGLLHISSFSLRGVESSWNHNNPGQVFHSTNFGYKIF